MIEQKTNGRVRIQSLHLEEDAKILQPILPIDDAGKVIPYMNASTPGREKARTWANQHSLYVSTVARCIVHGVTQQAPGTLTINRKTLKE